MEKEARIVREWAMNILTINQRHANTINLFTVFIKVATNDKKPHLSYFCIAVYCLFCWDVQYVLELGD